MGLNSKSISLKSKCLVTLIVTSILDVERSKIWRERRVCIVLLVAESQHRGRIWFISSKLRIAKHIHCVKLIWKYIIRSLDMVMDG